MRMHLSRKATHIPLRKLSDSVSTRSALEVHGKWIDVHEIGNTHVFFSILQSLAIYIGREFPL